MRAKYRIRPGPEGSTSLYRKAFIGWEFVTDRPCEFLAIETMREMIATDYKQRAARSAKPCYFDATGKEITDD